METIQVVLDKKLLRAADRAARQSKCDRSALVRETLRDYPHRVETRALEQRDREGYSKRPQQIGGALGWEKEAVWPE